MTQLTGSITLVVTASGVAGWLMDTAGRRTTATLALSIMSCGFLLLGVAGGGQNVLLGAALIIGFGNGTRV
jgi:MFS family permease